MADPVIEGGIRVLAQSYGSEDSDDVIGSNGWVFAMTTPGPTTEAALTEALAAVKAFYNAIASHIGKQVFEFRFKAYDMGEAPPRTPLEGSELDTVSSAASLPSEVACCLSYFNGPVARPRKRGRVFIGPLRTTVLDQTLTYPTVGSSTRSAITGAAVSELTGLSLITWGLLSQRDGVIWAVEHGFVDDAFDIQRRRGEDPTSSTTFST
jgi:hypothetical protein